MNFKESKIKLFHMPLHIIIILILIICFGLFSGISYGKSTKDYRVLITDKVVKDNIYLVYAKLQNGNVKVYEIQDSLLLFRWNSSDVYGEIQEGCYYDITSRGFRIPVLSKYPNIDTIKRVYPGI